LFSCGNNWVSHEKRKKKRGLGFFKMGFSKRQPFGSPPNTTKICHRIMCPPNSLLSFLQWKKMGPKNNYMHGPFFPWKNLEAMRKK
jgi:hypothetical protein